MSNEDFQLVLAHHLLDRLERLSADSHWAHHASGLRGSLLKCMEQIETAREQNQTIEEETWIKAANFVLKGFVILENAAREIRFREENPGS